MRALSFRRRIWECTDRSLRLAQRAGPTQRYCLCGTGLRPGHGERSSAAGLGSRERLRGLRPPARLKEPDLHRDIACVGPGLGPGHGERSSPVGSDRGNDPADFVRLSGSKSRTYTETLLVWDRVSDPVMASVARQWARIEQVLYGLEVSAFIQDFFRCSPRTCNCAMDGARVSRNVSGFAAEK